MAANKKHYYFDVEAFGRIIDAHFAYEDEAIGRPVEWYEQNKKAVWNRDFKLYSETDRILERVQNPDCTLFPLYRHLGQDEDDYIFETREDAEREYTSQIDREIADKLYDL